MRSIPDAQSWKLRLLEPVDDTELELLESDRFDEIVVSSELKCSPKYIEITMSTHHNKRRSRIVSTYQFDQTISAEMSTIIWELEICDNDII